MKYSFFVFVLVAIWKEVNMIILIIFMTFLQLIFI